MLFPSSSHPPCSEPLQIGFRSVSRTFEAKGNELQEPTAAAMDVVGDSSQVTGGGVMASLFSRATGVTGQRSAQASAFTVGDRGAILHHLDQAAIIPHVAESEKRKFPHEVGGQSCRFEGSGVVFSFL